MGRLESAQFARRIGLSFAATVVLALVITGLSVLALRSVLLTNDLVAFNHAQDLFDVERLRTKAEEQVAIGRGYLLTHDGLFTEDERVARAELDQVMDRIARRVSTDEDRLALKRVQEAGSAHQESLEQAYRMARDKNQTPGAVIRFFNEDTMPKFDAWDRALGAFAKVRQGQLEGARWDARAAGNHALQLIVLIAAGALALAVILSLVLTRTLTRLYDDVRVALRARDDVLAIVSRDLRDPLGTLVLHSSMLLKNPSLPADARQRLERSLYESSAQARGLIDNLLDFVRIELGRMTVHRSQEDPKELLALVTQRIGDLAHEKKVGITTATEPAVTQLDCDGPRVVQILAHLIEHAIRVSSPGQTVSVTVTHADGETLFVVRDRGPMIPPERLSRLFDRYRQAPGVWNDAVGLGLAVAQGLVHVQGGRIWAESQSGEGNMIYFTLPSSHSSAPLTGEPGLRMDSAAVLRLPIRASAPPSRE